MVQGPGVAVGITEVTTPVAVIVGGSEVGVIVEVGTGVLVLVTVYVDECVAVATGDKVGWAVLVNVALGVEVAVSVGIDVAVLVRVGVAVDVGVVTTGVGEEVGQEPVYLSTSVRTRPALP